MSNQNDSLKAAIDQGVRKAHEADGYLQADGSLDKAQVRERMFEVLRPAKVLKLQERSDKAVTRGSMVAQVFPSLPGPDSQEGQPDPQLALAVWEKIDAMLWSEARPSAGAPLQRLVGLNMGNGYILCRTQVGKDRVSAVYITDDRLCIERDFVKPDDESLQRKAESVRANRELLILRQPENGKRWLRSFDGHMKALAAAGHDQLALALEAATSEASVEDATEE